MTQLRGVTVIAVAKALACGCTSTVRNINVSIMPQVFGAAAMKSCTTNTSQQICFVCISVMFLISSVAAISPAPINRRPRAVCDNTNATPLIQKSDCAEVATYLEQLGQSGNTCQSKQSYHDEDGCTWMNTHGTCNANICDPYFTTALNCSTVAQYFKDAYNGCANDDGTLPGASYPTPEGLRVSVTYNGAFEQEPHNK